LSCFFESIDIFKEALCPERAAEWRKKMQRANRRILCVAEKPSIARQVAGILAGAPGFATVYACAKRGGHLLRK